jgi:LytS/YehU family sensor histidine kinase
MLVAVSLVVAWGWAALTPFIFALSRKVAPSRVGWGFSLGAHAVAIVLSTLAITALRVRLLAVFWGDPSISLSSFAERLVFWSDVNLFTYLAIVATWRAHDSHRKYIDRALRAHHLQTQLARAQLHYLELQLQPHFLFNSLNAIQELAHEAPRAAERMLRKLHTLLGLSLARSGHDEVSLDEELAALEPYIDIQRTRFSEWLTVRLSADEVARRALVPHLILQPLVENAIRHGLAVRQGPGHIDVTGTRRGNRLVLEVRDNGVGFDASALSHRPGIGLQNAGERLRQLYGTDHRFELLDAPGGGTLVEIEIPFRDAPDDASVEQAPPVPEEPHDSLRTETMADWRTGEHRATLRPSLPMRTTIVPRETDEGASVGESNAQQDDGLAPHIEETVLAPALGARAWSLYVGLWLLMAVFWTVQMYFYWLTMGEKMPVFDFESLKLQLVGSAFWIASAPLIFLAARRLRIRPGNWTVPIVGHAVLAVALAFAHLYATKVLQLSVGPILRPFNINPLTGNFFIYVGLVAWWNGRDFVAWYRAREVAAARLSTEIATSRFQALCVQLRPQFLLSTLDLLAQLVHSDVPRAEHLIARLADVLRLTLDSARARTHTLRQELHLLSSCVDAHRLGVRPHIALRTDVSAEALSSSVPSRLICTMVDDLLGAETTQPGGAMVVVVSAERGADATRVKLRGEGAWRDAPSELHAWWRKKSVAEAAVADAGPMVSVVFPDRATAVVILADPPQSPMAAHPAAVVAAA